MRGGVNASELVHDLNLDSAEVVYPSSKWIYYYENDNRVKTIGYSFSADDNDWCYSSMYLYEYDEEGVIKTMGYSWSDGLNSWEMSSGSWTIKSYDNAGNLLSTCTKIWSTELNDWKPNQLRENVYIETGEKMEVIDSNWSSDLNDWIQNTKYALTYDENGNLSSETQYKWSSDENDWIIDEKYEYTYDLNGNKTLAVQEGFRGYLNDAFKYEYTYDEAGHLILINDYQWSDYYNDWWHSYKSEYAFDAYGNETWYKRQRQSSVLGWTVEAEYEYEYGDWANNFYSGRFSCQTIYGKKDSEWVKNNYETRDWDEENLVLTKTWYDMEGNTLANYGIYCYYFSPRSESAIGVVEKEESPIKVAGREILTNGQPVAVYDMRGRLVYAGKGENVIVRQGGTYIVRCGSNAQKVIIR